MQKVLYITNVKVPYRVRFFNGLAKKCDLTVLYERRVSSNRDNAWVNSEKTEFKIEYLDGVRVKRESSFSLRILKYVFSNYDSIIFGCYNSPIQAFAIMLMRLFHRPFYINLDGEPFIEGNGIKRRIKAFFLKGAKGYFVAGKKAARSMERFVEKTKIYIYHFSSLSMEELKKNSVLKLNRSEEILVVGQYQEYKGLDVAVEAAKKDEEHQYKFVGMGNRADLFISEQKINELKNVTVVPFMSKKELETEYQKCAVMVLPSRQECWGVVINEAASFGTPIVSTWGSGAAVEFLMEEYSCFLSEPGNASSLYQAIQKILDSNNREEYGNYLIEKGFSYNIEENVDAYLNALGIER